MFLKKSSRSKSFHPHWLFVWHVFDFNENVDRSVVVSNVRHPSAEVIQRSLIVVKSLKNAAMKRIEEVVLADE